jgi:hypothetical protein
MGTEFHGDGISRGSEIPRKVAGGSSVRAKFRGRGSEFPFSLGSIRHPDAKADQAGP